MPDAGQVTVRFSVQDQEVVRKALEQLGRDGNAVMDKINAASQPAGKGLGFVSAVMNDLRGRALGVALPLGGVGQGLIQLGPAGLAAAAGIGLVMTAINKIDEGKDRIREFSRTIREGATQSGLSITQFQAFGDLAQREGVQWEQASSALFRLNAERANAARGQGELYDNLKRVNPQLAEQFAAAKSSSEALDVLARVLSQVDGKTASLISRYAFGRSAGAEFVQVMRELAGQGGLGAVTEAAVRAGAVIDTAIIQGQAKAAVEAERRARIVQNNWDQAYATIYNKWKELKTLIGLGPDNQVAISVTFKFLTDKLFGSNSDPMAAARNEVQALEQQVANLDRTPEFRQRGILSRLFGREMSPEETAKFKALAEQRLQEARDRLGDLEREYNRGQFSKGLAAPGDSELDKTNALQRQIEEEKKRLAVLGDVASAQERIDNREKEINLARRLGAKLTDDEAERVKESFAIQQNAGEIAFRTRIGVATATERLALQERELNLQVARGAIDQSDLTAAMGLYRKELAETIRQEEIRKSYVPQLTRYAQDAENWKASLDRLAVDGLDQANRSLVDFETGAKKGKEAFGDFVANFGRGILEMANKVVIFGPIARGLSYGLNNAFGGAGLFGLFDQGGYTGNMSTNAIAGVVHGREFVVNARATERFRPFLEAINSGVPGYQSGGYVQPDMAGGRASMINYNDFRGAHPAAIASIEARLRRLERAQEKMPEIVSARFRAQPRLAP